MFVYTHRNFVLRELQLGLGVQHVHAIKCQMMLVGEDGTAGVHTFPEDHSAFITETNIK